MITRAMDFINAGKKQSVCVCKNKHFMSDLFFTY